MGWLKRPHSRRHVCRRPILWPWVTVGSVWSCDTCTRIYHVGYEPLTAKRTWFEGRS